MKKSTWKKKQLKEGKMYLGSWSQGRSIMAASAQGIRSHCFCSQEADRWARAIPSLPLVHPFWYSSPWGDATYRPSVFPSVSWTSLDTTPPETWCVSKVILNPINMPIKISRQASKHLFFYWAVYFVIALRVLHTWPMLVLCWLQVASTLLPSSASYHSLLIWWLSTKQSELLWKLLFLPFASGMVQSFLPSYLVRHRKCSSK